MENSFLQRALNDVIVEWGPGLAKEKCQPLPML